ncbi:MAG: hypothetical protein HQ511_03360 [Rhodospirillales bacterium]|nr:hypothetical protein [Rhodospirillales bacterium]
MSELKNTTPVLGETVLRRDHLLGRPNPRTRLDYVVLLEVSKNIADLSAMAQFRICYVPDQLIITPESFDDYLLELGADAFESIEQISACVLDDINNQIVPRWVQVGVTGQRTDLSLGTHSVMIEDRQPNWDNPSLLARFAKY